MTFLHSRFEIDYRWHSRSELSLLNCDHFTTDDLIRGQVGVYTTQQGYEYVRFIKKTSLVPLHFLDHMIIPIHVGKNHWLPVHLDTKERKNSYTKWKHWPRPQCECYSEGADACPGVNVFWDPGGKKMVEWSWFFNPQTAIRKNTFCGLNTTVKELFIQMNSDLGFDLSFELTCDVRTIKEYQIENCSNFEPPPFCLAKIVRDEWTAWHKLWQNSWSHRKSDSISNTAHRYSTYTRKSRWDRSIVTKLPKVSTNSLHGQQRASNGTDVDLLLKTNCRDSH